MEAVNQRLKKCLNEKHRDYSVGGRSIMALYFSEASCMAMLYADKLRINVISE